MSNEQLLLDQIKMLEKLVELKDNIISLLEAEKTLANNLKYGTPFGVQSVIVPRSPSVSFDPTITGQTTVSVNSGYCQPANFCAELEWDTKSF